ncbi:MAG TPA: TonB-dependent receptor [Bryobacteraceae bacterium]
MKKLLDLCGGSLLVFAAAMMLLVSLPMGAQEVTAGLNGVVTDPSGAAVAGAKVTAKDLDRGSVFPTTTNGDGFYSLPRIPVGRYEVRVENRGFQTSVRSDIVLQLNQNAKVDLQLQVGQISQTVEVTGAPPLLQTEATQLGSVISARENAQLPLATRNYVQLTLLTAGAQTPNPSGFQGGMTSFQSARPYINGNRQQTDNFLLDGLDNNQVSDNEVAYAPSVDAIEEFNIITQNASAEFGNFMGGIVSVSIKAGTNQIHGNAFEFLRNDQLNANLWQNNFTHLARPLLRWNMFGGTAGGPILKNKLFIFGDYQGSRYDKPGTPTPVTVLTSLERQGNFSQLPAVIYNPKSLDVNGNRVPFAGNIIPAGSLNPTALAIINSQYYPAPTNGNLLNNQANVSNSPINGDQGDIRGDWNATDQDHVYVRYSQSNINNPTVNSLPLSYNSFGIFRINNGVMDYTRTISPSLVNDVRAGVNYTYNNTGNDPSTLPNLNTTFGIPGVPTPILPSQAFTGANISNFGSGDVVSLFADAVIQANDTVIWTKGQHSMKFGVQVFRERIDTFYSGNNGVAGTFSYNGQFTAGPSPTAKLSKTAGAPEADFLLGFPDDVGVGVNGGTWGQRSTIFAGFALDTWRINNKLTLTYGLRYENHTPWVEVDNREANFTPFGGQQIIAGSTESFYNNNRALYNAYNGAFNFQPRLGFAWTPFGNTTVIRASYTLSSYLEGTGTNLRLTINPPFTTEKEGQYTALTLPGSTINQGYTPIQSATDPFHGTILRLWDPDFRPAVSQQWNFSIQHQFGDSTTLQTAYVGQKNDHLVVAQPYLQRQLLANGTTIPSPYLSGNPTLQTDIGNISGTEANGNQEYDALQVTLQQRITHGLTGQFAYTWSKCMTDSIGFYGDGSQSAPASAYVQDLYNRAAEWGPCLNDTAHYVTGYLTYDLPIGRDRAFGKNMNKVANALVGGWQVNGILTFHSGFPLTVNGSDNSGTNARAARANCLAPAQVYGQQNSPSGGYQWFNPADFGPASAATFGSCGVGTVRGPGLKTADLSLSKKFQFTEHQNLEFRSEFINATNTPILNAPTRSLGSTLGLLQSSQGARNIQFGLKYNF